MTAGITAAQLGKEHKVLFEFTSEEKQQMRAVLNSVENVRKALGHDTRVTVVAHGPGIALLQRSNAEVADRVRELAASGVVFAACEETLRKNRISRTDLFGFTTTVDFGVAEVVRRQEAGWAYVKSGH